MILLYRGTRDGDSANIFHNKCDNQGPTICLCKNEKDNFFGGYCSISWTTSSGEFKPVDGSFLFSLTNIYNTQPYKFPNTQYQNKAIYQHSIYCGTFGKKCDFVICDKYLNSSNSRADLSDAAYPDTLGKGNSTFSGDLNTNYFKLKEYEVFKLLN